MPIDPNRLADEAVARWREEEAAGTIDEEGQRLLDEYRALWANLRDLEGQMGLGF